MAQRGNYLGGMRVRKPLQACRRARLTLLLWVVSIGWLSLLSGSAHALIVGSHPVVAPDTTVNPANFGAGWTKGDPGFNNVALSGGFVYLGDGWVLSARHVGYNPAGGITFQTAAGPVNYKMAGARVAGGTFIPGPYYTDYGFNWSTGHMFAVSNPPSVVLENGTTLSQDSNTLSEYTDLQLFRINGDPGFDDVTISSQPLPNSFSTTTAPELMLISGGAGRAGNETLVSTSAGPKPGYLSNGVAAKRWGTNRAADPADFPAPSPFSNIVSNTTGILPLSTGVGAIARDVIANITKFDPLTDPNNPQIPTGATAFESQAIGGDSGGSVFYKRNDSQWELSGIVNAVLTYEGQPGGTAVYGNATVMSDLSFYNQDYLHSIKDIIESHPDYSIIGDVNLDGVLSGNGTGPRATDDITAFVQGWKFSNGTSLGDITSWQKGDMNRDGTTNVSDFILLRNAFNGVISPAVASLIAASVPEPSTAALLLLAAASLAGRIRRRDS